jgi:molybdate transport system regulatory protein
VTTRAKAPKKDGRASAVIVPRFRIYKNKDIVLGPGKAELLEHIAQTGSISEAARLMDMSYNRAWLHVKMMNENFRAPLVLSTRGGDAGGGASLTATGVKALELYRRLEKESRAATVRSRRELTRLLKD